MKTALVALLMLSGCSLPTHPGHATRFEWRGDWVAVPQDRAMRPGYYFDGTEFHLIDPEPHNWRSQ